MPISKPLKIIINETISANSTETVEYEVPIDQRWEWKICTLNIVCYQSSPLIIEEVTIDGNEIGTNGYIDFRNFYGESLSLIDRLKVQLTNDSDSDKEVTIEMFGVDNR
ncbi:hypothetical protein [Evansella tamaricis]|uniref:Uncharacterized protein n=1 Tax=Evansella tamaricis TaxID=2069301 RepID=A0ABS6JLJ8_9BACI|nr:hypothetical protein [Evansella tamaricis]MBU9714423.1 hypothetical protein [Evansella tamaricis]